MQMEKRQLLSFGEPTVERILLRQCESKGYRVYPKMRLSDVIDRTRGEFLAARDFEYFCRAHFDFVIAKDHHPVFAVEFDGPQHFTNTKTRERDVIKHRLCRAAGLPLLRITGADIANDEQLTLLDYIVMRHVAWQEEIAGIEADVVAFSSALGPETKLEDVELELDANFWFDLQHPYPGSIAVCERLWNKYLMAWEGDVQERYTNARFVYAVRPFRLGPLDDTGFHTCEMKPCVWRQGDAPRTDINIPSVRASVRWWLPVEVDVPSAYVTIVGPGAVPPDEALALLEKRRRAVWEPYVPGAHAFDIAENYARHKGYRAIEEWAREHIAHRP